MTVAVIMLTRRVVATPDRVANLTLALTAAERQRSRHPFTTVEGLFVYVHLPRGTVLQDGDWLESQDGTLVQVIASPEVVLTVKGRTHLDLLRAAYHLGNRHVPLEIRATYLRLSSDPVLRELLNHLGLQTVEEIEPFQPETGAYGHTHP